MLCRKLKLSIMTYPSLAIQTCTATAALSTALVKGYDHASAPFIFWS